MGQTAIDFFSSDRISLQGILTTPEGLPGPFPTLLVCHPHPMLGGNMESSVVTAICRTAFDEGLASLRFNFRGVGNSEGTFTNGSKEQDDVRAGLEILRHLPGVDSLRVGLVGYSFGASVVLNALRRCKRARSLVLIAPPVASVRKSRVARDKRPKLFMVGQRDRVVPTLELQRALDDVRPPVQFAEIPDADHTLVPQLHETAQQVSEFMLRTLNEVPRRPGLLWKR